MPFISEHPEDVSVRKHEPTTLNCKADGHPVPNIEWYKDGELLRNTGNRMTLSSGSLFFLHVMHNKDTGTYWCTATNIAGTAISRKATLSLPSSSPSSSSSSSSTSSSSSSSSSSHHHHQHRKGNRQSSLAISSNSHAPPSGPPSDVSLKVLNKHSALLSWSPPKHPNHSTRSSLSSSSSVSTHTEPVTGYNVYARSLESSSTSGDESSEQGMSEQSNITTDGNTLSLTLNNLSPLLTYEVFVSAFNQEGSGPPSASLILRTDPMGGLLSRRPKDKSLSSLLSKDMITSMDPLKQPWWLLAIILLTVMFIFSSGVLIFLMRQRSSSKKAGSNKNQSVQHINLSLPKNYDPANPAPLIHDSMWIDGSWYGSGSSSTAATAVITTAAGNNGSCENQRTAIRTTAGASSVEHQSLLSHHQQNRGVVQQPPPSLLGSNSISQQKQSHHLFTNWSNNAPGILIPSSGHPTTTYDHSLVLDDNDSSVYSVIDGHNDYAEVSENQNHLSSFRRNHQRHNQQSGYSSQSMMHKKSLQLLQQQQQQMHTNRNQQQDRPTTPGPYATTNLINITSNALYRDLH